jgi:hypothetical protein
VQPAVVVLATRAVFITGRSATGRSVAVVSAAALSGWLTTRSQLLCPIERMELAAVIDNPLTWGLRPTILPRPAQSGD